MSIVNYTNFENINTRRDNEGKYILDKDFTVISNNESENVDFGECGTDVMEVSIYDVNNNLLPQKNGENVAYIRTGDIKNYLYKISRPNKALADGKSQSEIAIDAKKLLNDLGFQNGILKLNINFVRNRVGTENKIRRAWIQEISPSRQEVRILPLKTNNKYFDDLNQKELQNLKNLNKDFKYYKKSILDSINKFDNIFLEKIDDAIIVKYGNDFFNIAKKDFGLKNFNDIKTSILNNFKDSVTNYLNNKAYDISQSNFGLATNVRFIDCDQYDFEVIITEIQNILNNCIKYNLQFLKRRDFDVRNIPQEFKEVDLTPDIVNISNVVPPKDEVTVVYDTSKFSIQKPINNDTPVIRVAPEKPATPIIPPVIPKEIKVNSTNTFTYFLKNDDSRSSAVFKFFDAAGNSVQKILSPGQSAKICAVENSVSAATFRDSKPENTFKSIFSKTALPKRGKVGRFIRGAVDKFLEKNDLENFIIKKEISCDSISIGNDAPKRIMEQTSEILPQNINKIITGGGGGGRFELGGGTQFAGNELGGRNSDLEAQVS